MDIQECLFISMACHSHPWVFRDTHECEGYGIPALPESENDQPIPRISIGELRNCDALLFSSAPCFPDYYIIIAILYYTLLKSQAYSDELISLSGCVIVPEHHWAIGHGHQCGAPTAHITKTDQKPVIRS